MKSRSEHTPSDLELVQAIRRGEAGAWETLLKSYQNRLYTVCFRMVNDPELARDLTQEAMVRIIQGLDSYNGQAALSTWMIRITMNVCLSRLRSEKLRRHASLDHAPPGMAREPSSDERVLLDEQRGRLLDALNRIAPEHRSILVLRDVRGLDYEQVAEVLDLPVGTVKSRLFRARAALREALE